VLVKITGLTAAICFYSLTGQVIHTCACVNKRHNFEPVKGSQCCMAEKAFSGLQKVMAAYCQVYH